MIAADGLLSFLARESDSHLSQDHCGQNTKREISQALADLRAIKLSVG